MKILITGGGGQLGRLFAQNFFERGLFVSSLTRSQLDISDLEAVRNCLKAFNPDLVINCAAYTNLDMAENELSPNLIVNHIGPSNLAITCNEISAGLIHFSTDHVFHSEFPFLFSETSNACPINAYGMAKYSGEASIRENLREHWIIRTAWLYGPTGGSFVANILKSAQSGIGAKVVVDQFGQPTYSPNLIKVVNSILSNNLEYGTYHSTGYGYVSRFEFAKTILSEFGLNPELILPINTNEIQNFALRPKYSLLGSEKWGSSAVLTPIDWHESLRAFASNVSR